MSWFEFTLVHVAFMSCAALINKRTLNVKDLDELVFGAFVQLTTGLICFVIVFFEGFDYRLIPESISLFPLMIIVYLVAVSLFFVGLKNIDLSEETILSSTGAVWGLVLGTLFFGEIITIIKIAGVVLVVAASLTPFVKKEKVVLGRYQKYILIAAFFYALGAVFDKKLNSYGSPISYIALSFTIYGFVMLAFYGKRTLKAFNKAFRKIEFWKGTLINGVLYAFAFWALFKAYQEGGEISRMFPMTLSTSVIVPILGVVVLKEHDKWKRKLIAVIILLFGIFLIRG